VIAHEIGHNLGMDHDFVTNDDDTSSPRYSSTGADCTDVGGIMDYTNTKTRWSPCSVEDFNAYFNSMGGQTGEFCLATNNGNNKIVKKKFILKTKLFFFELFFLNKSNLLFCCA
jgi:hypothetical protein